MPTISVRHAFCTMTLDRLLIALFFLIVTVAATFTGFDSDTWWQLRSGQLTLQSGFVWTIDPLSSTGFGNPWSNHEWLAQILFFGCYQRGGELALVGLGTAIIVATWAAIRRLCVGPPLVWVSLLSIGIISHGIVWSIRPHLFTLLGVAVLLFLLLHQRTQVAIPALFLLWANLHGGVAFGGVVLAISAAIAVGYDRRSWRRWGLLVGFSALATLCTPLGIGLWSFTLSMIAHPQTRYIREWLPPSLGWPVSYPFFMLAITWMVLVALSWRKLYAQLVSAEGAWPLTFLVLGVAFLIMGTRAIRHTPLFTIVALPLISSCICNLCPTEGVNPITSVSWGRGLGHSLTLILAIILSVALIATRWSQSTSDFHPLSPAAITAVRACPGTLYNSYTLGGAVLWFLPERPVFVDSRNDPYPLTLLYSAVLAEQRADYTALFAQYQVNCVLVEYQSPLRAALEKDSDWKQTYIDHQVTVFAHH